MSSNSMKRISDRHVKVQFFVLKIEKKLFVTDFRRKHSKDFQKEFNDMGGSRSGSVYFLFVGKDLVHCSSNNKTYC